MNAHMPLTEAEGRSLERLARRYSVTTMEIMILMGKILREEFYTEFNKGCAGEPFVFQRPHLPVAGLTYFANANVPGPDAVVDLFEARQRFIADMHIADVLLDEYHSRDLARDVLANTIAWARFWAARFPTPEGRARYTALTDELAPKLRVIAGGLR